ncbi:unnamed protein product [Coccothraustes coccothraustes]
MQPPAAHGARHPTAPVRPPQSALRLASPPPAGGEAVRGGRRRGRAGAGAAAGGRTLPLASSGRGATPATPGGAAGNGREGSGVLRPPSFSSPNFPVLDVGR